MFLFVVYVVYVVYCKMIERYKLIQNNTVFVFIKNKIIFPTCAFHLLLARACALPLFSLSGVLRAVQLACVLFARALVKECQFLSADSAGATIVALAAIRLSVSMHHVLLHLALAFGAMD